MPAARQNIHTKKQPVYNCEHAYQVCVSLLFELMVLSPFVLIPKIYNKLNEIFGRLSKLIEFGSGTGAHFAWKCPRFIFIKVLKKPVSSLAAAAAFVIRS